MELVIIFVVIFIIYGAGWIWQAVNDVFRDINRTQWDGRVYGQVTSSRSLKRQLGGQDLAELRRVYGRFAEEVDGQLHDRAPFESPKVSFVYKTSRALLSIYESSDEPPEFYTQLTFTIGPGWSYRVEVFPQRITGAPSRFLNIEDIQVGDPVFDPRYVVKANDTEFVKEFLGAEIRRKVDELRELLGNDRVLISINSSRLLVRKQGIVVSYEHLVRFVTLSNAVYDRILTYWQKAAGIEIMDEGATQDTSRLPVCQVCGVAIPSENRVHCRRCKTPHHPDCWSFNDGCSTYACGEKQFIQKY